MMSYVYEYVGSACTPVTRSIARETTPHLCFASYNARRVEYVLRYVSYSTNTR